VPSCGSGIVVVERLEAALARGAKPYAELLGAATNSDGGDMTLPTGDGARRCLRMALEDAAIPAERVDYINAHATSTVVGDQAEAEAIADVFGNRPWVSSTKSMTGHEIAAAGSNELIYTLLMMRHGFVAPNINLEQLDSRCAGIRIAANVMQPASIDVAVSNSFGFGGVNCCLVVRRFEADELPPKANG
jgi:3-oxoacyl-[acyl-carrier-protein] synthase-1